MKQPIQKTTETICTSSVDKQGVLSLVKIMYIKLFAIILPLTFLTGCAELTALQNTPQPATAPTSTIVPVIASPTTTATSTTIPDKPRMLRIWVPPQFDPAAEAPANVLLQERLDEFVGRRPGLQIEVRVKAESMPNTLEKTQAAAPVIMPDLVALSRADLETTAAQGLLHPLDGLTTLLDNPDWYPYAQQMAHIQNTVFGLPFAGDTLTLIGYANPLPTSWYELPKETLFVFPAADPQALFSLSLYLSAGGLLVDNQGLPTVNESILTEVLTLFLPSKEQESFLYSAVTEYTSNEQAWNAFLEQRGNLTVSWASNYLQQKAPTYIFAPLPGLDDNQYTLATGWSWALTGSNSENQALTIELAEFLSDSSFLAEWSQAAGYLPTRPTALLSREDAESKLILEQTVESAHLVPTQEILDTVGPLFAEATLAVINGEQYPSEAAQSVVEKLK